MISRRFSPRARNFPRVFATLFFFFSFFRRSFLLFFTVISRRVFCFYSSLFASRNFESNRARESNGGLVAREIRELRVSTLNAENMFKKKKKKKAYFRNVRFAFGLFQSEMVRATKQRKISRCMLRTRNYV